MLGAQSMIDILDELITATTGYLDACTVHLVKDDYTPSPTGDIADLVAHEADYTGYAASAAVEWLSPYLDANGDGVVPAQDVQFQPTGTTTANTIYGWWLQKGTGGSAKMVVFQTLDEPVVLASPFDSLLVEVAFRIRQE